MYGVDMTKPGAQEYYDSVFALMASWDLDFVKVDDLSSPVPQGRDRGDPQGDRQVRPADRLLHLAGRDAAEPGEHVQVHANLWRISDDFWDNWRALYAQFARLDSWTPFRGPGHWPDADMLPLGNVRAWQTTDTWTHFTHDEQFTLMTLWSIARSPLIMGGNLPKNDDFTLALLTNDEVLAVNQNSTNNRQLFNTNNTVAWVADVPGSKDKYVALFNTAPAPAGGGTARLRRAGWNSPLSNKRAGSGPGGGQSPGTFRFPLRTSVWPGRPRSAIFGTTKTSAPSMTSLRRPSTRTGLVSTGSSLRINPQPQYPLQTFHENYNSRSRTPGWSSGHGPDKPAGGRGFQAVLA